MSQQGMVINPILQGFNPDPSILRLGCDYYIATSTFEWFPGVQIHHSTDLINWNLLTRPLTRPSQLNLEGVPDSCGVWAPCLTHKDGLFYLVYSIVRSFMGAWKDTPNYLVTAKHIQGPWSEPVTLHSRGFDASLFHDDDGRSYLVSMLLDHRNNRLFGGIILQEYDTRACKLVGNVHHLFNGTEHGSTEGPHIYKRNNYYYLLVAEGGTSYKHCITLLRARSITGPYELHPNNPIITAKYSPENYLQKAGHGDLVETQDGEWYAVFLTGRPLSQRGRCTLGRETAIAPVYWADDDWLYHRADSPAPKVTVEGPAFSAQIEARRDNSRIITFSDQSPLDNHLQSLRVPITEQWANLTSKPGYLRLSGRDSLSSTFNQSLLGQKIQAHHTIATVCMEFEPENFQQLAGLVCYYNTSHYHYLHVSGDDYSNALKRKFIKITSCDNGSMSDMCSEIEITNQPRVWLKAEFKRDTIQFYFSTNYYSDSDANWQIIGPELDGSILSDDYVEHPETGFQPCFTGAFYGICCQDLSGMQISADFKWFNYLELEEKRH